MWSHSDRDSTSSRWRRGDDATCAQLPRGGGGHRRGRGAATPTLRAALTALTVLLGGACAGSSADTRYDAPPAAIDGDGADGADGADADDGASDADTGDDARAEPARADVVGVSVSGAAGAYQLSVTLRSPDTGCARYADWWEVVSPAGELLYRRILAHSHVDEQPFTRSGGPAAVAADAEVIVRAHLHDDAGEGSGYGGVAWRGTPAGGFGPDPSVDAGFAAALESAAPTPSGCAF